MFNPPAKFSACTRSHTLKHCCKKMLVSLVVSSSNVSSESLSALAFNRERDQLFKNLHVESLSCCSSSCPGAIVSEGICINLLWKQVGTMTCHKLSCSDELEILFRNSQSLFGAASRAVPFVWNKDPSSLKGICSVQCQRRQRIDWRWCGNAHFHIQILLSFSTFHSFLLSFLRAIHTYFCVCRWRSAVWLY